jgi:hypothetical protein
MSIGCQAVNDRQGEGGDLACARLGDPQHVSSGKTYRDGFALDGRWFVVTFGLERPKYRLGKAEL